MSIFRNPVSYSIYVVFGTLLLLSFGEAPLVVNAATSGQRIVLSVLGIILVVIYFLAVVIGYIVPRLH